MQAFFGIADANAKIAQALDPGVGNRDAALDVVVGYVPAPFERLGDRRDLLRIEFLGEQIDQGLDPVAQSLSGKIDQDVLFLYQR